MLSGNVVSEDQLSQKQPIEDEARSRHRSASSMITLCALRALGQSLRAVRISSAHTSMSVPLSCSRCRTRSTNQVPDCESVWSETSDSSRFRINRIFMTK